MKTAYDVIITPVITEKSMDDAAELRKYTFKVDTKAMEKEVRRLEREIEKEEQRGAELDEALTAAASDYQELMRLTAEKDASEQRLAELMEQWERAAEQIL